MLVEPAASLSDFALGTVALGVAMGFDGKGREGRYWRWSFAAIGVAGLMGGIHHGFLKPYHEVATVSWSTISFIVAIAISFLLAATVATVLGEGRGRSLLAVRVASLVAYLVMAILGRAAIQTLLITEGLAMIMIMGLWAHAWRVGQPGAGLVLVSIGTSVLAGAVRIGSLHWDVAGRWELDTNALYHLAQMPGLVLLYVAVRRRGQFGQPGLGAERASLSPAGGT